MPSSNQTPSTSENISTCSASASTSTRTTTSSETHTCPHKDCNKSFSKKYNLKAHLRLHTGEEPFECDRPDCRKKFKWRSSLSSHSIWHTRKDNGSIPSSTDSKSSDPSRKDSSSKSEASSSSKATRPAAQTKNKSAETNAKASNKLGKKSLAQTNKAPSTANMETSAVTASANLNKKKRPRSEYSRKPASVTHANTSSSEASCGTTPSLSEFCFSSDGMGFDSNAGTGPITPKSGKRKASRPSTKKRKTGGQGGKKVGSTGSCPPGVDNDLDIFSSPGSPVTSESGLSEHSLGLDFFSCDMLPPLMGNEGEGLTIDAEDVGALLGGDVNGEAEVGMFGYGSPACGALNGLDTRFGSFDLDNFQNFCLGKTERL